MKVIKHEKAPKPTQMTLQANPLTVWLSKQLQLIIEEGDKLKEIRNVVIEHWGLEKREAAKLAAYWFAVGERQGRKTKGPWSAHELRTKLGRKYAPRTPVAIST